MTVPIKEIDARAGQILMVPALTSRLLREIFK
jgi:hypothetical protein